MTSSGRSVALVLGSGGILGSSFHAGVLLALEEVWGFDGRRSEELLGTSAGALTAAFLTAGVSPADLVRREHQRDLTPEGAEILSRRPSPSASRRPPTVSGPGLASSPTLSWNALRNPGHVMPGSILGGLLPRGRMSTEPVAATVDGLLENRWPSHQRFRVAAVRLATGTRHVFSEDDHIRPGQAVAAACAVPAIHRPVKLGADEYVDGAIHSANNLDAVGRHDLVIVSSPSTGADWVNAADPMLVGRLSAGLQLRAEMRRFPPECRVVVLEPDRAVLSAMGPDIMRTTNRAAVSLAAHQMATNVLREAVSPFTKDSE